jgi:Ca-activated chloride channel family protein
MNASTLLLTAGLLGVLDLLAPFVAPSTRDARRGVAAYHREKWEEAAKNFQSAVTASPDGPGEFNLGAAAYRLGKNDEASEAFGRSAGYSGVPAGDAAYNLGDARYRAGDYQGAVAAFRAALRENPADDDARVNYEIALKRLSSPPDSTSKQNQDKKNRDQQGDQGKNGNQGASSDSTRSSPQEQQGKQGDQNQDQADTPPQPRDKKPSPGEQGKDQKAQAGKEGGDQGEKTAQLLTPEEARRLLDAVIPDEKELLKARLKPGHRKKTEKDW